MQPEASKDSESELYIPARLARACKKFRLTARERQVLFLLAGGATWKGVAAMLDVSISTVRFHVDHICEKTAVENPMAALGKIFKVC